MANKVPMSSNVRSVWHRKAAGAKGEKENGGKEQEERKEGGMEEGEPDTLVKALQATHNTMMKDR
jgi:hypothetical protein